MIYGIYLQGTNHYGSRLMSKFRSGTHEIIRNWVTWHRQREGERNSYFMMRVRSVGVLGS